MSMPTKTQIAQAQANIGKVGRSIEYLAIQFVIVDYIIINDQIVYRVKYLADGAEGYESELDTKILPGRQAYQNLATGEIHVSSHDVYTSDDDVTLTSKDHTTDVQFPTNLTDYPEVEIYNSIGELDLSVHYLDVREMALMLLHAADLIEKRITEILTLQEREINEG